MKRALYPILWITAFNAAADCAPEMSNGNWDMLFNSEPGKTISCALAVQNQAITDGSQCQVVSDQNKPSRPVTGSFYTDSDCSVVIQLKLDGFSDQIQGIMTSTQASLLGASNASDNKIIYHAYKR